MGIVKSEENLSYWELVKHFDKHLEYLKRCELFRSYSKSLYQLRMSKIDTQIQQQIIMRMAMDGAVHGTKIADSSRYSIARYIE